MGGYYPPRYGPGDRIAQLLLEQGRIAGEGAERSGQIWGSTLAGLGQQIGGQIQQYGQQQEEKKQRDILKKQDQAFLDRLSRPEPLDPREVIRIYGPQRGMQIAQGLEAFNTLGQKRGEEAAKALPGLIRGMDAVGEGLRAQLYPGVRQKAIEAGIVPEEALPAQYDPKTWEQISAYGKSLTGEAKTREIKIRNADGSESIQIVEDKPGQTFKSAAEPPKPETRSIEAQLADAAMRGDQTAYQKLLRVKRDSEMAGRKPEAAPRPQIERVETVDEQGKPVTRFVTPTVGATYAKPTGAGKPATGQQRRALSFFNRGKEAQEIASSLEEGKTISPTSIKYIPDALNVFQSNPDQSYIQAQRAFTEARLRKESGAAINKDEYKKDALTYFAQPGNSKEMLAQKRAMRNAVLAGIAFESGDALKEFYGEESEGMLEGYKAASRVATPQADAPIVQRNTETGLYRHSLDGGKTWKSGKP